MGRHVETSGMTEQGKRCERTYLLMALLHSPPITTPHVFCVSFVPPAQSHATEVLDACVSVLGSPNAK